MADGNAAIDDMIRRLRAIGRMAKDGATDAAREFEAELKRSLAAGVAPGGAAWQATKAGGRPLKRAAAAVTVTAVGSVVLARLTGHHVWHHFGTAKVPQRQQLPTGALPGSLGDAIKRGLVNFWNREVKS